MRWSIVVVRLVGAASRDRVAVWRELRRGGAVPIAQGVWTVPATAQFDAAIERAAALAARGNGEVMLMRVDPGDEASQATLRDAFEQARLQEWQEFDADCTKYEAEIAKEVRTAKFTLAELEEEEQSLERLRRWYHDLKSRDVLRLAAAVDAAARLRGCEAVFDAYAEQVYDLVHGTHDPPVSDE